KNTAVGRECYPADVRRVDGRAGVTLAEAPQVSPLEAAPVLLARVGPLPIQQVQRTPDAARLPGLLRQVELCGVKRPLRRQRALLRQSALLLLPLRRDLRRLRRDVCALLLCFRAPSLLGLGGGGLLGPVLRRLREPGRLLLRCRALLRLSRT